MIDLGPTLQVHETSPSTRGIKHELVEVLMQMGRKVVLSFRPPHSPYISRTALPLTFHVALVWYAAAKEQLVIVSASLPFSNVYAIRSIQST